MVVGVVVVDVAFMRVGGPSAATRAGGRRTGQERVCEVRGRGAVDAAPPVSTGSGARCVWRCLGRPGLAAQDVGTGGNVHPDVSRGGMDGRTGWAVQDVATRQCRRAGCSYETVPSCRMGGWDGGCGAARCCGTVMVVGTVRAVGVQDRVGAVRCLDVRRNYRI